MNQTKQTTPTACPGQDGLIQTTKVVMIELANDSDDDAQAVRQSDTPESASGPRLRTTKPQMLEAFRTLRRQRAEMDEGDLAIMAILNDDGPESLAAAMNRDEDLHE